MHRHRILAQISLILSVLNLVLAAPIAVPKGHEARYDQLVVAEDVAAMLKKRHRLEASSDRLTLPRSPIDDGEPASPQPSDGSTSALEPDSGNPGPSHPSSSGQSEIQLPALSPELEAGLPPPAPHSSPAEWAYPEIPRLSSASSETPEAPLYPYTPSTESGIEMPLPERLQEFVPGPQASPLPAESASPHPSTLVSPGIPNMPIPEHLQIFVPPTAPQILDGLPPSSSPQPPEVHPDNGNVWTNERMKKLWLPTAVVMIGGTLIFAGLLGLEQHYQKDN